MNQPGNMMPSTSDSPGDRGPAPKRKKDNSDTCEGPQLRMNPACIVHVNGLEHGQLQLLSNTNDADSRLLILHKIHAKRLSQTMGSVHRMDDTCDLIPDVIT